MRKRSMIWIFGAFGCGGTTLVVTFVLIAAVVAVVTASKNAAACGPDDPAQGAKAVQAKANSDANSIPKNYLKIYQKVGKKQNIPWNVLAGIGFIETNHGRSKLPGVQSGENYAGAGGPMQFLKSSWAIYGEDGDGDGKKDRYNPADAIPAAANHLRGSAGKKSPSQTLSPADIRKGIFGYNHSQKYVNDVLAKANQYGKGYKATSANNASASSCAVPASLGSGSFGERIANAAAYFTEKKKGAPRPPSRASKPTPYSWGGGGIKGPSYGIQHGSHIFGFDCSGLAQYAVYKASKGKIVMPDTTHPMWNSKKGVRVPRDQLAPGDLVFFRNVEHMGIYYGEVNGVRWMVEALKTGTNVMFSKFDGRSGFVGARRVKPPAGMGGKSPEKVRVMAPAGAGEGVM